MTTRNRWFEEESSYTFFPRTKAKARKLRAEAKESHKKTFALYGSCIASNASNYMMR